MTEGAAPGVAPRAARENFEARQRSLFLSYTAELREYPERRSYVAAAESAAISANCGVIDMRYFPPGEDEPAQRCVHLLRLVDVYVVIAGFRYGTLVPGTDISYVELEFETATRLRLPRLIFLLDEYASHLIPASRLFDVKYGGRQAKFRKRLESAGPLVAKVADPGAMEHALFKALVAPFPNLGSPRPTPRSVRLDRGRQPPRGGLTYGRPTAARYRPAGGEAWSSVRRDPVRLTARTSARTTETWLTDSATGHRAPASIDRRPHRASLRTAWTGTEWR